MTRSISILSPDAPPAEIASHWLADIIAASSRNLDLSGSIVILPTRSAARLVRSELISALEKKGVCGFGGLRFFTPELFINAICADINFANIFDSYSAWFKAFDSEECLSFTSFFPRGKSARRDYSYLASQMLSMRRMLAEAGLTAIDVAEQISVGADSSRWADIAALEKIYLKNLAAENLVPAESAPLAAFEACKEGVSIAKEIFLVGVPDPSLQLVRIFESLGDVDLRILSFADEDSRESLDEWGRPRREWNSKPLSVGDENLIVFADLREQSDEVAAAVASYGRDASRACAVACNEADSSKPLLAALAARGIDAYIPEGRALSDSPQVRLLKSIADFIDTDSVAHLLGALRNPALGEYLSRRTNRTSREILENIDKLLDCTYFDSLSSGVRLAGRSNAYAIALESLVILTDLTERVRAESSPAQALKSLFDALFSQARESVCDGDGADFLKLAEFFEQSLQLLFEARKTSCNFSVAEAVEIILESARSRKIADSKSAESVALIDWIEVFWSSQPHVILTDMNEGIVPQNISDDFFLPDSIKEKLGMRDSKMRRARDAWMLDTLIKSRAAGGAVSIIVPRKRLKEPAGASDLLLQCADSELAARIEKLFATPVKSSKNNPFEASWKIKVPWAKLPAKLSPSAFKAYIACPFNFYLQYVLRADTFENAGEELGRDRIGTLVHAALEQFISTSANDSSDVDKIASALAECFDTQAEKFYGDDLSAALLFQLDSVKSSLMNAAGIQADLRARGYKTLNVETQFDNLEIGGFKVSMRIDRIDEAPDGSLLLIDYKTKDSPKESAKVSAAEYSHRRNVRGESGALDPHWFDLQLPLYVAALQKKYPDRIIECAHFIISKDAEKTDLSTWTIDSPTLDEALEVAETVAAQIRNREFSPSPKRPEFDNYEKFFKFADGDINKYLEFENEYER